MDQTKLQQSLGKVAFAFRGYNVANLGRSHELLEHAEYGPVVRRWLERASACAAEILGRPIDLVRRVQDQEETSLDTYGDAIALVVAMELAQIELLKTHFQIDYAKAQVAFGYSLGEITALVAGGVIQMEGALRVPISLSQDAAELAEDVTLGVFFSRRGALPLDMLRRLCIEINSQGRGVMGISAYLSPNSVLLMGQDDTLDRFYRGMRSAVAERVYLRKNDQRWPPMHTPIVWERNIPNRAAVLMHTIKEGLVEPQPPVLSLVSGKLSYNDYNAREILHRWIDHPQRLWDAVYATLAMGVETIIHVGPAPNIIPATFHRLQANVEVQTRGRLGMRALAGFVKRPWLASLLPVRTALLRAPLIQHVILEDWLLEGGRKKEEGGKLLSAG